MKKFIALYMMPAAAMAKMMETSSPEEMKSGMDEWRAWGEKHRDMLIDLGNPLGKNVRVTSSGTTQVSNDIGGYSFVEAESAEAAAAVFKDCPHLQMPDAYIELMPIVEM